MQKKTKRQKLGRAAKAAFLSAALLLQAACAEWDLLARADGGENDPDAAVTVAQKGREPSKDNTFYCLPGCRLKNDAEGMPIIPDWCELWAPETPVCGEVADGVDRCAGEWVGDETVTEEHSGGQVTTEILAERLNIASENIGEKKQVKTFVCTKINYSKTIQAKDPYGYRTYVPDQVNSDDHLREFSSIVCHPGCILDAPLNGYEIL